jgi:hypothetical protein
MQLAITKKNLFQPEHVNQGEYFDRPALRSIRQRGKVPSDGNSDSSGSQLEYRCSHWASPRQDLGPEDAAQTTPWTNNQVEAVRFPSDTGNFSLFK